MRYIMPKRRLTRHRGRCECCGRREPQRRVRLGHKWFVVCESCADFGLRPAVTCPGSSRARGEGSW